ncbi:site-specific integrase [Actinokineospora sp. HUAS TT18]|uniref:site-specific integrase n=1 Tax=Actinokineospora sp. HUAS TT18 TaxID=3447451 RepID=UPI003F52127E
MARAKDDMSQIRQRGNSLQVSVLAGTDPLTGKRLYLSASTTDLAEAKRIRTKFRAQVAEQRNARTKATFQFVIEEWLKVHDIEETTRQGYELYLRLHIGPALGDQPVSKISARVLEQFYAQLRKCSRRCGGRPQIDHRVDGPHECRTIKHWRPRGRMPAAGYPPHDCGEKACKVTECAPHKCKPLSNSTILKIHFVIQGALAAAVRWEWIASNPAEVAKKPEQPTPKPNPPTSEQAAQIIAAAWERSEDWGTLVWLVMVTGIRRAELLALRWRHVDLVAGKVTVKRNYVRARGVAYEKDTKTHQERALSLDPATVEVLREHRQRYEDLVKKLNVEPTDEAFLFSYEPTRDRPYDPSAVSHRYADMCAALGIDSHLHALRHYSATELLTAGIDLRTVAGRLGHGGGGATTLRVYAAWVGESDRRAAELLGGRMQRRKPAAG